MNYKGSARVNVSYKGYKGSYLIHAFVRMLGRKVQVVGVEPGTDDGAPPHDGLGRIDLNRTPADVAPEGIKHSGTDLHPPVLYKS